MKKPKKITVKFFLNKNLHPLSIAGELCYPLYTQITYDRKNTQIKCAYGWFYRSISQIEEEDPHLLPFEEKVLKKSVSYELSIHGDSFRLKGLGKKYEHYCVSTHALFNSYLKIRFKNILKHARPSKFLHVLNLDKPKIDFFTLYEAAEILFDNIPNLIKEDFQEEMDICRLYHQLYKPQLEEKRYQFPVVIDWLEGSHQDDLRDKLKKHFNTKPEMVEQSLSLINKIVSTKLELV